MTGRPLPSAFRVEPNRLCPRCNAEAVSAVLSGFANVTDFRSDPGVIDAHILEESGRILMRKTCAKHGTFEDVLSTSPAFFKRMESLYFGHDFACAGHTNGHDHGPSTVRTGRGIALIVDLTNRCNLKCSPCFMDANHSTYVHELSMDDVRQIFDRAAQREAAPRREHSVRRRRTDDCIEFPRCRQLREKRRLQPHLRCHERNPIRSGRWLRCKSPFGWCPPGVPATRRHLERKPSPSRRGQLFDVKRQALENISRAGMQTNLQVTVMNGVNNGAVGEIVRFAVMNIEKVRSVLFQPIMFTGRDANVGEDDRRSRRYTFADLARRSAASRCAACNGSPCVTGSRCRPTASSGTCSIT